MDLNKDILDLARRYFADSLSDLDETDRENLDLVDGILIDAVGDAWSNMGGKVRSDIESALRKEVGNILKRA